MVNNHYDKTMLPSTALTMNRLVGKAPRALTQYLSWAINSTKRLGRTISGSNEYGKYADMGRPSRIARGIGVEIVPKAVTAMALGVPIAQVMGGRDWTGVSSGDYSGIQAEDKTVVDEIVNTLAVSPTLGMVANLYNGYRTNQEGIEEGEAESPWLKNAMLKNGSMLVPYFSQGKKVADIIQGQSRGYYENSDGRIQTGALPTGEAIQGALVGKSYTPTFRDMRDNPDAISVARGTAQVQDLVTHNDTVDNVSRALLDKPTARDYTRPLSKDYTKAYKEAEKGARDALLKGGRQYNDYLDTLRQQSPELYERYLGTMDGDHVKPEYWRTIFAGKDGKADLTTFKVLAERKRQLKTDLGKDYDPMYDLPDDQAKAFLEYRSTPTGDNIAIRNILGKEQWYKDLKAARKTFYDANPLSPEGEEFKKSERVKAWETYEDKLNSFFYDAEEIAKSGDPAWAKDFPLVYRQKQLNDQFGFDAPETKEFFKANYDSWKAQKDNFDKAQLEVINQMRKLEGYPPMSWDGYQQATEFADTDESDDSSSSSSKGYGRSGRGGRGGGKSSDRTGVASTITELGNEGAGMKLPTGPKGKMKNLKTVVKNKRAKGTSPIRIRI